MSYSLFVFQIPNLASTYPEVRREPAAASWLGAGPRVFRRGTARAGVSQETAGVNFEADLIINAIRFNFR